MSTTGPFEEEAFERDAEGQSFSGDPRELWRRFRRQRVAMAALLFIVLVIVVAIAAPLFAPNNPNTIPTGARVNALPSWSHLLGTDDLGRDILSRIIFGARASMTAVFLIVGLALAVALPLGLISGYFAGRVDAVLMRVMDVLFTFPPLILALAVASMLGPSLVNASIAIALVFVPSFVRLIRGQVLAVREELYVEASRSLGLSNTWIVRRHVLPNVASPIVVQAAVSLGYALLAEAGLSFLGLGVQLPTPSWGNMLNESFGYVLSAAWPLIPPGLVIFLTVLAFNLIGDGLRDALGRERFEALR